MCVFMQGSEVRVNFVVMRATEAQEEGGGRGVRRPEPQYFRRRSVYMKVRLNITGTVINFALFLFAQCDGCSFVNRSHQTQ